MKKMPFVSVIVTTYNRAEKLKNCLSSLLKQSYNNYEIIVVNDGSTDNTENIILEFRKKNSKIRYIRHETNLGTGAGKKDGIKTAKSDKVALIDDDCILDKNWLRDLTKEYEEHKGEKIAAVTSVSKFTGHSIIYNKRSVNEAGFFDPKFNMAYCEDTDLAFRLMDLGYKFIKLKNGGNFMHDPPCPKTFHEKINYGFHRIYVHSYQVLLYKKNPERTKNFLDIKFGFLANPIRDFKIATGLWGSKKDNISLSSPQGIILLKNKSFLHEILIILLGLFYSWGVALSRLWGSIKFKKLLI